MSPKQPVMAFLLLLGTVGCDLPTPAPASANDAAAARVRAAFALADAERHAPTTSLRRRFS